MTTFGLTKVHIPADVPSTEADAYESNFRLVTKDTGRLMLFAGDQKVEHLNDDFYGTTNEGPIAESDANPQHLFEIADKGQIGCFATQFGLIARYGRDYPNIPYLVKLNSKTHLVKTSQQDPRSIGWMTVNDALQLKESGLNIAGIGYTVYPGSEFESEQFHEAAQACLSAHRNGLIAVLWIYPRGKSVANETDPHLIAGATGLGATLGADFCKVNYPQLADGSGAAAEAFREAVAAAGRTRVITAGGKSVNPRGFLQTLHDQISVSGAFGSATGRNIHQKPLDEAIRMTKAISAITYSGWSVDDAVQVFEGTKDYS